MAATLFKSFEVVQPNILMVAQNGAPYKRVYLPFCPKEGKDSDCQEALTEILEGEAGVVVMVTRHNSSNPVIWDVQCDSMNRPLSDILVERGLAIKWNLPQDRGVVIDHPAP